MKTTLANRVVLVTGATSGLGRAAATALAARGALVIVHGRHPEKTTATARAIREHTSNPRVETLLGDLLVQADVRRMAAEFLTRHERLDVLINNAGGGFPTRALTVDGVERTWALNHLSAFLLTNLLQEALMASPQGRVIGVTSSNHRSARIAFDDPNLVRGFSAMAAYGQAKLANILFTAELARRLRTTLVTANVVDPGPVRTNMFYTPEMSASALYRFARNIHRLVGTTPERGAATIVELASRPDVASVTGEHWHRGRRVGPARAARNDADAHRLWDLSERMTGLTGGARPPVAQTTPAGAPR